MCPECFFEFGAIVWPWKQYPNPQTIILDYVSDGVCELTTESIPESILLERIPESMTVHP